MSRKKPTKRSGDRDSATGRVKRSKQAGLPQAQGFEFGLPPEVMVVGNFEFIEQLGKANIVAVAYGIQFNPQLSAYLPLVSLVGRQPQPLRDAFRTFAEWDDLSAADSLRLTFVTLNAGGYLLGIRAEIEALRRRTLGWGRYRRPIMMAATWVKQLDTRHAMLDELRQRLARPISPMTLSGSYITDGLLKPLPIPGCPALIKFKAYFHDEIDVEPNSEAALVLAAYNRKGTSKRKQARPSAPAASEVLETRRDTLRRNFPVTLWRLRQERAFHQFQTEYPGLKISEMQYAQAVCNLHLSKEITGSFHYPGIAGNELAETIANAVDARFETANASSPMTATSSQVLKQLEHDAGVLLMRYGKASTPRSSKDLFAAIARRGFSE